MDQETIDGKIEEGEENMIMVKYYAFGDDDKYFKLKDNQLFAKTNGQDYQVICPNYRQVEKHRDWKYPEQSSHKR